MKGSWQQLPLRTDSDSRATARLDARDEGCPSGSPTDATQGTHPGAQVSTGHRRNSARRRTMAPSSAVLARQRRVPRGTGQERSPKEDQNEEENRRTACEGEFGRHSTTAEYKRCCCVRPTRLCTYNRKISGAKRDSERSEPHRGDSVRERAGSRHGTERPLIDCRAIGGNTDGRDINAMVGDDEDESDAGHRDVRLIRKNGLEGDLEGEQGPGRTGQRPPSQAIDGTDCPAEQGLGGPISRRYGE